MKKLYAITTFLFLLVFIPFQSEAITMVKLRITGQYFDETAVRFMNAGSPEYDFGYYDAMKLFSPYPVVPGIYTKSSEQYNLAINSLDTLDIDTAIMLYARIGVSGNYELKVMDMVTDSGAKAYLEDLQTDSIYELTLNAAFSFYLEADTVDHERFRLIFSTPAEMDVIDATCNGLNDGRLFLADWGNTNWWYELYDTTGTLISGNIAVNEADSVTGLSPGNYILYCNTNQLYTDIFSFSITAPAPVVALFSCNNTVYLPQGDILNLSNQSSGAGSYFWDFGDGNFSSDYLPAHAYTNPGTYTLTLTVTNGNCGDQYSQQINVIDQTTGLEGNALPDINIWAYNNWLNISSEAEEPFQIEIYNLQGKLILHQQINTANHSMLISEATGIYAVSVIVNNQRKTQLISIN